MKKSNSIILVVTSLGVVGVLGYLLLKQLDKTKQVKNLSKINNQSPTENDKLGFGSQFAADMEALKKKQVENRSLKEMRDDFESTFTKKK